MFSGPRGPEQVSEWRESITDRDAFSLQLCNLSVWVVGRKLSIQCAPLSFSLPRPMLPGNPPVSTRTTASPKTCVSPRGLT